VQADQGTLRSGDMLCDPAFFFDARLNGSAFEAGFSHRYVAHPFRTHFMKMPSSGSEDFSITSWFGGGGFRVAAQSEHFLCRRGPAPRPSERTREIAGNRLP
jgi:hypothetical protein